MGPGVGLQALPVGTRETLKSWNRRLVWETQRWEAVGPQVGTTDQRERVFLRSSRRTGEEWHGGGAQEQH